MKGTSICTKVARRRGRLFSFGLYVPQWQTLDYQEHPEIGKIEGDKFEPEEWKPRVPVAALRHARADDTLWAALRVMAFTDAHIQSAVKTGGYTDPAAEKLLADVLIKRRDKIGRVYFSRINPLVRFALSESGALTFENPSVRAGFEPKQRYEAVWASFDNSTGEARQIGTSVSSGDEQLQAPAAVPAQFRQGVDPRHRAAACAVGGTGRRVFPPEVTLEAGWRRARQRRIVRRRAEEHGPMTTRHARACAVTTRSDAAATGGACACPTTGRPRRRCARPSSAA